MTANISKDAKTASIHLPVGRSVMAGVLSYLGIEHKDENDLPCYGSNEMSIQVTLEYALLVLNERTGEGILVNSEGSSYARYSDDAILVDEQYHFDEIKSKYPDTYDFLMSLDDRLLTLAHYQ